MIVQWEKTLKEIGKKIVKGSTLIFCLLMVLYFPTVSLAEIQSFVHILAIASVASGALLALLFTPIYRILHFRGNLDKIRKAIENVDYRKCLTQSFTDRLLYFSEKIIGLAPKVWIEESLEGINFISSSEILKFLSRDSEEPIIPFVNPQF